jgi:hypothetical protein
MNNLIDLDFFNEHGYVIIDYELNNDTINLALNQLSGLYKNDSVNYNENNRIQNGWSKSSAVYDIACDNRVIEICNLIFGKKSFPFQTLNFDKGTQQLPHSDYIHFASSNHNGMCGVWFALEDVNDFNGPLVVYPGSHKLPSLWPEDLAIPHSNKVDPYKFYNLYEEKIQELIKEFNLEAKYIKLNKGQGLIWHSNLLHGGSKIINNNLTRKSQVTHYFASNEVYFTPLTSYRSIFGVNFRIPFDITVRKRAFKHISLFNLIKFVFKIKS